MPKQENKDSLGSYMENKIKGEIFKINQRWPNFTPSEVNYRTDFIESIVKLMLSAMKIPF